MPYIHFQRIEITSTVALFSNAIRCPGDTFFVEMQADTGTIRFTFDGTEPTSEHGYRLQPDHLPSLFLVDRLSSFACVSESGATVGLNLHYWGTQYEENPDYESSSSSISTSSLSSLSTSSSSSSSKSTSSVSSQSSSSSSLISSVSTSTSSSSSSSTSASSISTSSSSTSSSSISSVSWSSSVAGPGDALLTEDGTLLLLENGLQLQIE